MSRGFESIEEQQERGRAATQKYLETYPTCSDDCKIDSDPGVDRADARVFVDLILDYKRQQASPLRKRSELKIMGLNNSTTEAVLACVKQHDCGACIVRFSNKDGNNESTAGS